MAREENPHQGGSDEVIKGLPEGADSRADAAEAASFAEGPGRLRRAMIAAMTVVGMVAPGCVADKKDTNPNMGPDPISDTADRTSADPEKSEAEKFDEILKNCAVMPLTEPGGSTTVSLRIGYTAEMPTTMKLEILDSDGAITPVDLGDDANVQPGQNIMTGVISIADIPNSVKAFITVTDPKDGKTYTKEQGIGNELVADGADY